MPLEKKKKTVASHPDHSRQMGNSCWEGTVFLLRKQVITHNKWLLSLGPKLCSIHISKQLVFDCLYHHCLIWKNCNF